MEYHISYPVELPRKGSVTVTVKGGEEYLEGTYSERRRREVFKEYREELSSKGGLNESAHVLFARCGTDTESIIKFTTEWGVVGRNPGHPLFRISLQNWRKYQAGFKQLWRVIAEPDSVSPEERSKILESLESFLHYGPGLMDSMGIGLRLETVPTDDGKQSIRPVLEPSTLWSALLLMLWRDAARGKNILRICENPKCAKEFRADKAIRKFCSEDCAHRHANLQSYHRSKVKKQSKRR